MIFCELEGDIVKVKTLYDATCRIKNVCLASLVYKVNKIILNIFFPIVGRCKNGIDEGSNIIISLTSFPERIDTVWMTIVTLLNQTVKPRLVVLWLADEQFPNREKDLPVKLIKLIDKGLSIRFCDNLYPHKKYYYTMKEHPDKIIITVDDDIFYPEYLVEELMKTSIKYPNTICCTWAHEIKLDKNGQILPYSQWRHCVSESDEPSLSLMPVGCGGVLYPPRALDLEVFNDKSIRNLTLKTDDLWLKCMAIKKKTPSVRVNKPAKIYFSILKTQNEGLHYENVGLDKNDVSMKNILTNYPECKQILSDLAEKDI